MNINNNYNNHSHIKIKRKSRAHFPQSHHSPPLDCFHMAHCSFALCFLLFAVLRIFYKFDLNFAFIRNV